MDTQQISILEDLPVRTGGRPLTGDALPHLQLADNSTAEMFNELAAWLFSLEDIEERPTIISVRGARAAWIRDGRPNINYDILQHGHEFTHIHPDGEYGGGSQHLSLLRADCELVIEKGWGEYHPMDHVAFPDKKYGHIMVYAPRDPNELEVVKRITTVSYKLVTNQP